jgi:hypothetical protein
VKPLLVVFLCCKDGKNTEYFYTTQKTEIALLEEVDNKIPDDESLLCVWTVDWRVALTGKKPEWEVVAQFGYEAEDEPSNAQYFLDQVMKKGATKKEKKERKEDDKPKQVWGPLYEPPFKIVVADYPREKAA